MIKCSFCGYSFSNADVIESCAGCPLKRTCNKYKCPKCGFEIPKQTKIAKIIKKLWREKSDYN